MRGTLAAIEREPRVDGLVQRYPTESGVDGLSPGEGVFLACSFWLVDNLVLQGRRDEARRLFDRLLGLRNDVGLLAEQYDPRGRRQLGNFPQALSHIALINSVEPLGRAAPRRAPRRTLSPAAAGHAPAPSAPPSSAAAIRARVSSIAAGLS